MTQETATQAMQRTWDNDRRMDFRRRTADMLTNALVRAIEPFLADEHHARSDAAHAILNLLMDQGLFVMTEHDRQALGLPQRDDKGWTVEEIRAYDARFLANLLAPMPPMVMRAK